MHDGGWMRYRRPPPTLYSYLITSWPHQAATYGGAIIIVEIIIIIGGDTGRAISLLRNYLKKYLVFNSLQKY